MQQFGSTWLRRSAAQLILGGIGLAAVTFVGFRFGADVDMAAFGYFIVIALTSLIGRMRGVAQDFRHRNLPTAKSPTRPPPSKEFVC